MQEYVNNLVHGMKTHADNVLAVLNNQTNNLSAHTKTLNDQNQAMEHQSEILSRLEKADLKRETREDLWLNSRKNQSDWVKWAIPIGLNLVVLLVAVVVFLTHK
jgi:hypothetical protein